MRHHSCLMLILLVAWFCLAGGAAGRESAEGQADGATRLRELEIEIKALRAENALLRKELDDARAKIKVLEAVPTPEGLPAGALEGTTGTNRSPLPPASAQQVPAGGKTYASALEILRDLPAELKPHPVNGWDKFVEPKVEEWLTTKPIGERFEMNAIVKSATIKRNPAASGDPSQPGWVVHIHLEGEQFKYISDTFRFGFGWPSASAFQVFGDDDFARRAERLKAGHRARLTGKIERINLGPSRNGLRDFRINLTDYTITSAALDK